MKEGARLASRGSLIGGSPHASTADNSEYMERDLFETGNLGRRRVTGASPRAFDCLGGNLRRRARWASGELVRGLLVKGSCYRIPWGVT